MTGSIQELTKRGKCVRENPECFSLRGAINITGNGPTPSVRVCVAKPISDPRQTLGSTTATYRSLQLRPTRVVVAMLKTWCF